MRPDSRRGIRLSVQLQDCFHPNRICCPWHFTDFIVHQQQSTAM